MTMPVVGTWTIGSGGAFGLLTPPVEAEAATVAAATAAAAATVAAATGGTAPPGVPGGGEALALPTEPGSLKPWVLLFSSGPSKKLRLNSLPASNDTSGVRVSGAGALPKPALSDWSSLKTSIVRASNVRTSDHGVGDAGGEQRGARRASCRCYRLRHSAFARAFSILISTSRRRSCGGKSRLDPRTGTFAVFAKRTRETLRLTRVTLLSRIFENRHFPRIERRWILVTIILSTDSCLSLRSLQWQKKFEENVVTFLESSNIHQSKLFDNKVMYRSNFLDDNKVAIV